MPSMECILKVEFRVLWGLRGTSFNRIHAKGLEREALKPYYLNEQDGRGDMRPALSKCQGFGYLFPF